MTRPRLPAFLARTAPDWLAALSLALFCGAVLMIAP